MHLKLTVTEISIQKITFSLFWKSIYRKEHENGEKLYITYPEDDTGNQV